MPVQNMSNNTVTYEHPLNEHIRICLKLEHLFYTLHNHSNKKAVFHSRQALVTLLHILDVINRPDLKSRFTQALIQYKTALSGLQSKPRVDTQQLKKLLNQFDTLITQFHSCHSRIADDLHHNKFLTLLRSRLNNPGGVCDFDTPELILWLDQNASKRVEDLHTWINTLHLLEEPSQLILRLARHSTSPRSLTAHNGFYQQNLDPNCPYEMIRIQVPHAANVFPQLSVGRHRLTVRFLIPQYHATNKPTPFSQEDIHFALNCCRPTYSFSDKDF